MNMNNLLFKNNKKLGGLYGALLGDACGCPYEFKKPAHIPPYDQIDMVPPPGYNRTWKAIPVGTYTDDGAQTLVLMEILLSLEMLLGGSEILPSFDVSKFRAKLYAWLGGGYMSVDNITFDSGNQTKQALMFCNSAEEVIEKLSEEKHSGNGSLMRSIPVALVVTNLQDAMTLGAKHSLATHPNARCQMICALYCGVAFQMLDSKEADDVLSATFAEAYKLFPQHRSELDFIAESERDEVEGSGYVVDAFWSALHALRTGKTFKDVIKNAIALGNDTDTTACIAGGLAGIKFGYDDLPDDWLGLLRGKHLIQPLADRLAKL
jgi:ADP-ribosyl-[dinitrogen reductase] hydrolase